ncbi:hypothetical protein F5Y19DRAFT_487978 [Xylariaceae sp. FL1651]|nr:hypothetical protein F5Y19DRAFT_487978 [Xylariaceae sp. FL1651]
MSRPRKASRPPRQLYFAYGSNLWLKQMAARCPDSCYIGRAILPDHRWQINQRGFANIVPASGFTVHGLVYELRAGDEARLDRSEGVSSQAYSKAYKPVLLHCASAALQLPIRWLIEDGGPEKAIVLAQQKRMSTSEPTAQLEPNVLVYISENFVRSGQARDEYIDRMNSGIRDAVSMGVPNDFFENAIREWIPNRPALRHTTRRVSPRHSYTISQTHTPPRPRRSRMVLSSTAEHI